MAGAKTDSEGRMQRRQWMQQALWGTLLLAGCGGSDIGDDPYATAPRFTLVDLGSIDGFAVSVTAINERGDTTGTATAADGRTFAYLHTEGRTVDLSALFEGRLYPRALNGHAWVVGRCVPNNTDDVVGMEDDRPFLFDGSVVRQLHDELGEGGEASDINDHDVMTGRTNVILDDESLADAFTFDEATMVGLGHLPGGRYTDGTAINASGWVTGFSEVSRDDSGVNYHAFLHDGNSMRDLGTLGGAESFGNDLNASGWVTGWSVGVDGQGHAFIHDGQAIQDLGLFDGQFSIGYAINDAGQVVGRGADVAVISHGGRLLDLNLLLTEPSEWRLSSASAILADGRVLAQGQRSGQERSFLLVPAA